MGVHRGVRRVPLREAAKLLGVSKDAVRQRIRRGTIRSDKGADGRVYVYVDASTHDVHERVHDESALVEELRDRVAFLERELERKDAILLNMTEAMKAIAPPAQEEPAPPTPQPGRVEPRPAVESMQAQESSEMAMPEAGGGPLPHDQQRPSERPWWRRIFGP